MNSKLSSCLKLLRFCPHTSLFVQKYLGAELLLLRTFELLLFCLLEFDIVSEKSDVNLVFMHSLILYFDSALIWIDFSFR